MLLALLSPTRKNEESLAAFISPTTYSHMTKANSPASPWSVTWTLENSHCAKTSPSPIEPFPLTIARFSRKRKSRRIDRHCNSAWNARWCETSEIKIELEKIKSKVVKLNQTFHTFASQCPVMLECMRGKKFEYSLTLIFTRTRQLESGQSDPIRNSRNLSTKINVLHRPALHGTCRISPPLRISSVVSGPIECYSNSYLQCTVVG
jgi:hypothetical protein